MMGQVWYILTKPIESLTSSDSHIDIRFQTVVTFFRRAVRANAVKPGYDRDYEGMFDTTAWSKLDRLPLGARMLWAKGLPASESMNHEQRPMAWETIERAIQRQQDSND